MIHTLIEKITEYGWNSKKGRDYRMVKEGAIEKLLKFSESL